KNYSGDVMNFRLAEETLRAGGTQVESVVIHDDLTTSGGADGRGVGVTVVVEKMAGAKAETRAPLSEVAAIARKVSERRRSVGVALSGCVTPAMGRPTFELAADEMEFGVGIHGEPGRRREGIKPAADLVEEMIDAVLADFVLKPGSDLLVLLTGLGGTPLIE